MFALFNNITKEFIGYSPEIPDTANILKKEIANECSDLEVWKWEGDYETGKMVQISNDYPIKEIELEKELFSFIARKYPLDIQLINIIKQLRKITKADDSLENTDFSDMADVILNAIDKHKKRVNYFQNYGNFESKREKFESLFRK